MFSRTVRSFAPSVYDGIVEMEDILSADESLMDVARRELYSAFANTFVLTADLTGVIMFEKMLGISADEASEDLEFRRQRLMNRMSTSPPFTFRFLKQKLDDVVGKGAWKAYIDFDNYTLYIESSAADQSWYSEIAFTIARVKPCNMVFINVPYTASSVNMSEEISYATAQWRYRLGSWRLSQHPFVTLTGGGTIKMPNLRSIQSPLLQDTANFVVGDIASVLLNDTVKVTQFSSKQVSDNEVIVEYTVLPNMTNLITDIKLLNSADEVLTHSTVYVPVADTIMSKHIIRVKEGA